MTNTAYIRPAWTPVTIGLMILGFMIFWPLGLAMLAYILWGDRLDGLKRELNNATDGLNKSFKRSGRTKYHRSGNVAFDEWREEELARIDEERRKLHEAFDEFETYQRDLRRAKDHEEFEAFMKNRKPKKAPPRSVKSKDD
ncbi:MAG: DUF2852 domain-containing protein [Pseudomonadota bacterium]